MSVRKIVIDPLTRIEGHLKFATGVENGVVVDARCSGEMFRGIEKALIGYDARVAQQVTQRVCGVCPYAHAEAASLALENAMGFKPNENGQLLRNLIVGAYHMQDYLLHFYTLCALDFIDITAVVNYNGADPALLSVKAWVQSELAGKKIFPAAPFLPRYKAVYCTNQDANITAIKNYLDAIPVMADICKMVAIFGGKAPHPVTIEAGGVTVTPTVEMIFKYKSLLDKAEEFITRKYFYDVVAVATVFKQYFKEGRGYGNLLSYPFMPDKNGGNFTFEGGSTINGKYEPLDVAGITEDTKFSYYKNEKAAGGRPLEFTTLTPIDYEEFKKEHASETGKYSWTKAPRYKGEVMEVGAAARIVNTYRSGKNPKLNALVDKLNAQLGITVNDYNSVMGRHLCRLITSLTILDRVKKDLQEVVPNKSAYTEKDVPKNAVGYGLTEASRGALGHWIATDDKGYIKNYELIVPTTWNISPRDASDRPGAVEKMLISTKVADEANPMELARIVRSTDPCIGCSVH
jgi:hydrogenase large subunit